MARELGPIAPSLVWYLTGRRATAPSFAEQIGNNIQFVAILILSKHAAGSTAIPTSGALV